MTLLLLIPILLVVWWAYHRKRSTITTWYCLRGVRRGDVVVINGKDYRVTRVISGSTLELGPLWPWSWWYRLRIWICG